METRNPDFYTDLKSKNPITDCALELNYAGKKHGSYWQGDCPAHRSSHGNCLTIYPRTQSWICFHCGEKGDVINLVMLFKRCDHRTAVAYLAKRAGIPLWGGKELSPEELAQREAELHEKLLLEDMLTAAAHWFHEQLKNYPQVKQHLHDHYGFSDEVIEELRIGFAPPGASNPQVTSDLAKHMESNPGFKGKLAMSSLFTFKTPSAPFWDYFRGRITFPYWKGGKVVNLIARATDLTPADKFECYAEKDGVTVKRDDQCKPAYIKYKKLRTHIPDDEKRKHISRFINADAFMGEDSIRGAEEVIITEGAPDFVSAVDKGFACISPVTTNFRESDFEKLEILTRNAKRIFLINDNEDNQAGYIGAFKTGKYLTEKGRDVFLVKLPMPQGSSKIDLNEYFKDHTAAELKAEMEKAKSILQLLIDQLPPDYLKAQANIQNEIAPLLLDMDEGKLLHFIKLISKKTGTTTKVIAAEIDAAMAAKKKKEAEARERAEIQVDPEIEKAAAALAKDPQLFRKRLDIINEAGVVGERRTVAMYFCAMDSRLLPNNIVIPNVLAMKNAGHYGAGKSYTLTMCTQVYPEEAFFMITNGSGKSLYFLDGGLKHRCLIVTEGFQFQENNASDSELVYSIRSLISEGRVSYCVVEKGEDGKLVTVEKKLEGPTSFITTTVMDDLEPQLEDRLFTIHPDEGFEQTKDIITMTGLQRADLHSGLDKKVADTWKHYHRTLKPVEVVIPFSPAIASFITKNPKVPLATRRAFNRVLIVIQSVVCSYQHQRKKDQRGKLIAEIADYWMALQIVREAFQENLSRQDKKTEERLQILEEKGPLTPKALAEVLGVSAGAVSQWSTKRVGDKTLAWCDEFGEVFTVESELKKAKHIGKAYLKVADDYGPINVTGLPTPFELTGNPDWGVDGKLLKQHDLELDKRVDLGQVFSRVQEVFIPDINTMDNSEPNDTIEESDNSDTGVKVFSDNEGDKDNEIDESKGSSLMSKQVALDLVRATATKKEIIPNKKTDELSVELANIMGDGVQRIGKVSKTPGICRTGCKHYDGVKDVNDGQFKEFCCQRGMTKIDEGRYCACFESKQPKLPEGVLPM
ncbi:MAG TPA: CHC2 zinc finger domain-containing protein [Syntrophorhabdus sp.]|nr:CHC2 zinc finger domain-containing protein [Syntrophorhabdus sp.]